MNEWVYEGFESTYNLLGVSFDKNYYESQTYLLGKDIIKDGLNNNIFYKKDDSSVWIDLDEEGLDKKLLLRLKEKNFVRISEKEINITPVTKIIILYLEYPIEFFDFIKSKAETIANSGIYKGLNILLKNSCETLSNIFCSREH